MGVDSFLLDWDRGVLACDDSSDFRFDYFIYVRVIVFNAGYGTIEATFRGFDFESAHWTILLLLFFDPQACAIVAVSVLGK